MFRCDEALSRYCSSTLFCENNLALWGRLVNICTNLFSNQVTLHFVFVSCVWFWVQKRIIFLNCFLKLTSVIVEGCVLFAVRIEFLNIIWTSFGFKVTVLLCAQYPTLYRALVGVVSRGAAGALKEDRCPVPSSVTDPFPSEAAWPAVGHALRILQLWATYHNEAHASLS
jgi:hypothetical protein